MQTQKQLVVESLTDNICMIAIKQLQYLIPNYMCDMNHDVTNNIIIIKIFAIKLSTKQLEAI